MQVTKEIDVKKLFDSFKKEEKLLIDISTEKISIMLVNRKQQEVIIKDMMIIQGMEDCFKDGMITKPDRIVNEIHHSIKEMNIKCKNIWLSYGSSMLQTKIIKLVEMNEKDLGEFIDLEYQRQFPTRSSMNYVMDYQVLGNYGTEKDLSLMVLLASAPKSEISDLLREFKIRKYKVNVVDADVNSIKNVLVNIKTKEPNKIIFEIGKNYSIFMTIIGNVLVFTRDIKFGYENLIKAIQKKINMSSEEIEKLLESKGIYSKRGDIKPEYLEVIEPIVKEFLEGMFKSIEYVKANFQIDIDSISLCGEGAYIKGIDKLIKDNLSIDCKRWVFKESDFDGYLKVKNETDYDLGEEFIKTIGLSLRGMNK